MARKATTKLKKRDVKTSKPYAIYLIPQKGKPSRYITKIGYRKDANGKRYRAWQDHGQELKIAQQAEIKLRADWEDLKQRYKRRKARHVALVARSITEAIRRGYYIDDNDDKVDVCLMPSPSAKSIAAAGAFRYALDRYELERQKQRKNPPIDVYRAILEEDAPEMPVWPTEDK